MKFSLVVATRDRVTETDRLLASLEGQSLSDFEVLLVDQNLDGRLDGVIDRHARHLRIRHLHSGPGVSRGRNEGLAHAAGDIVAFPDDDCWYPPDLLERVAGFFEAHPEIDGLTGRPMSPDGRVVAGRFSTRPGSVDKYNIWTRAVTAASFLRRHVVEAVGGFDEALGPGAATGFGSGDDTDYFLRALAGGFRIFYDPEFTVLHPEPVERHDAAALRRARTYGPGTGRVLRRHGYPLWFVAYQLARPLGGTLLALLSGRAGKARYHATILRGRAVGWLKSRRVAEGGGQ